MIKGVNWAEVMGSQKLLSHSMVSDSLCGKGVTVFQVTIYLLLLTLLGAKY